MRQRPTPRAVGQRLLDEPQIPPLPGPAHQRRRHVVEAGAVERLQKVDGRLRTVAPARGRPTDRRDRRSRARWPARRRAPTPPGPGRGGHAPDGGERQRRQLGVAQGVRADGQPVVVLEQPEGHLVARPQEVRLVADTAQTDDQMGQPAVHLGHQIEQARPAGQDHLGPADGDLRRGRRGAIRRPGGARARPQPRCAGLALAQVSFHRPPILVHQIEPQKTVRAEG